MNHANRHIVPHPFLSTDHPRNEHRRGVVLTTCQFVGVLGVVVYGRESPAIDFQRGGEKQDEPPRRTNPAKTTPVAKPPQEIHAPQTASTVRQNQTTRPENRGKLT